MYNFLFIEKAVSNNCALLEENTQKKMLDQVKTSQKSLTMAGDGRHDTMGHSAKYCAYTMFCCNTNSIIHFSPGEVRKHVMLKHTKLTESISISIYLL